MAEDLRQIHTDGKIAKEGFVRVRDVSGAAPGEYTKYAGFTVVPRSMKEGRMENGKVSCPVLARTVDKDYKIVKEEMVMPFGSMDQPVFPGIGAPAAAQDTGKRHMTVEDIRSVLQDDAEIERAIAEHTAPPPSAVTPSETQQMMQMMMLMMQQQMMQNNPPRAVQAPAPRAMTEEEYDMRPPVPQQPAPPTTGPWKVSFSGDFGTIRTTYETVVVRDDCVVLGAPADVEGAYEPPVNPEKVLMLAIAGQPKQLAVVNPGLSFTYKGDNLIILLVEKQ